MRETLKRAAMRHTHTHTHARTHARTAHACLHTLMSAPSMRWRLLSSPFSFSSRAACSFLAVSSDSTLEIWELRWERGEEKERGGREEVRGEEE